MALLKGAGVTLKRHRSFDASPNDKRSSASFLPLTEQDEGINCFLILKDSKMPYLACFASSGHDIFIYGTKVQSFSRSFGRTLCGDAHVGLKASSA